MIVTDFIFYKYYRKRKMRNLLQNESCEILSNMLYVYNTHKILELSLSL